MTQIRALQQQFQDILQTYHKKLLSFPALLGDGHGTVEVDGRPGYVYYRLADTEEMFGICLNRRAPNTEDLAVIIGYDILQPSILQVLQVRQAYANSSSTTPAELGPHHETHEFGDSGSDVVWVQQQQFVPLLTEPTSPATMTVEVNAGQYGSESGFEYYTGATSADLSSYKPVAGTSARFVVLSIDVETNTLQYTEGDTFGIISPPANPFQYVPTLPDESVPLSAILLTSTTTSLGWDQIYDIRVLNNAVRDSPGPAANAALESIPRLESDIDGLLFFLRQRIADIAVDDYLFVPAANGYNYTDSLILTPHSDGVICPTGKLCHAYGFVCVPNANISSITAKAAIVGQGNGDVYIKNSFFWGACGAAQGGYTASTGYSAITLTSGQNACTLSTTLSNGIASGVIINCAFYRDGTDISDTLAANCNVKGWILELS